MDPLTIILFVFLFLLSAFFSGTEIALMSLPSHKVDSLVKQWKFWSKALKYIKDRNDKLLITILIWNNLVNVYTATLATQIAMSMAKNSWMEESLAIWISTWAVTFLLLMFWEIAPKSFATKNSEKISLFVAKIYKFLMTILFPIVFLIEKLIKLFTWKDKVSSITNEEIEAFIDMWKDSWTLEHWEHEKIKSILEFNWISVEEIMTPRVKIDALSSDTTIEEAKEYYLNNTHSRIPIYNETIDKIDYFLTIRDILEWESCNWKPKLISDLDLTKVLKVPINQPIDNLLETFQKSRKHLAIIIDEYGWVSWLITLEDIIEEVFWEIRDETDIEDDEIKSIWKDSIIVESHTLIEDVLDEYELELKDIWLDEKEFDWETTSYVITHVLERFPNEWEKIVFDLIDSDPDENKEKKEEILQMKIIWINEWRIDKVEIKKKIKLENNL